MYFERGLDPKKILDIGWEKVLKDMRGRIYTEKDLYQNVNNQFYTIEQVKIQNIRDKSHHLYNAVLIIVIVGTNFKVIKNVFRRKDMDMVYPTKKLSQYIIDLVPEWKKWKEKYGF